MCCEAIAAKTFEEMFLLNKKIPVGKEVRYM